MAVGRISCEVFFLAKCMGDSMQDKSKWPYKRGDRVTLFHCSISFTYREQLVNVENEWKQS